MPTVLCAGRPVSGSSQGAVREQLDGHFVAAAARLYHLSGVVLISRITNDRCQCSTSCWRGRQMESAPRRWVRPSQCSSLRTWIHKRWHYVYWDGCEGDESLVWEAGHRWFGLEFAKQKRVGEEKAIRNEAAGTRYVKFVIRMLFSLAFAPWYALAVAVTEG